MPPAFNAAVRVYEHEFRTT